MNTIDTLTVIKRKLRAARKDAFEGDPDSVPGLDAALRIVGRELLKAKRAV